MVDSDLVGEGNPTTGEKLFEKGSIVIYGGVTYKIIRLYPKAGRVEMRSNKGVTIFVSPFFMQWRRE